MNDFPTNNITPIQAVWYAGRFRKILTILSQSLPEVREILHGDEIETALEHQAEYGRDVLSLPTIHRNLGYSSIQTAGNGMVLLILADKNYNEVTLRFPSGQDISDSDAIRIRTAAIALEGLLALGRKREA